MFRLLFVIVSSSVLLLCATVCRGRLVVGNNCPTSKGNSIQSPGFDDGNYQAYSSCTYKMAAAAGNRASLKISEFYVLGSMPNCSGDYLEVKVGCGNKETSMGRYCSHQSRSLPTFHSPDGCLTVVFKSDGKGCAKGFQGNFSITNETEPVSQTCGTNKTGSNEMLSPSWPQDYTRNDKCNWILDVNDSDFIRFFFTSFLLEIKAECEVSNDKPDINDEVFIYGVSNNVKTPLKILCHDLLDIPNYFELSTSGYNTIEVTFFSDNDDNHPKGFAGGYVGFKSGAVGVGLSCDRLQTTAEPTTSTPTTQLPVIGEDGTRWVIIGPLLAFFCAVVIIGGWFLRRRCRKDPLHTVTQPAGKHVLCRENFGCCGKKVIVLVVYSPHPSKDSSYNPKLTT